MSELTVLRDKLNKMLEHLEFETYYNTYVVNSKNEKEIILKDYITKLSTAITDISDNMFSQCAFPCLVEMILNKDWRCAFHIAETCSPQLEHVYQTGNYQSATFSYIDTCYERNETRYFTVTWNVINLETEQYSNSNTAYQIKYTEHKTCAPFSDIIETKTGTINCLTKLKEWVDFNI